MAEQRSKVPAAAWRRVFQDDPDGLAILEELAMEHVYASPFVAGQPDQTQVNLGKQALVLEILNKLTEEE